MNQKEVEQLLSIILDYGRECEWIEFKDSNAGEIGEYISALANSATLYDKEEAYLVFGIDDKTKEIKGTNLNFTDKDEIRLRSLLDPKIDFCSYNLIKNEKNIIIFVIESAKQYPIKYRNEAYIRINSCKTKLSKHADKEKKLWLKLSNQKFETTVARKCNDEEEILSLLDYSNFYRLLKIPIANNKTEIIEKLTEYKLIRRKNGKFCITNLGAILFSYDLNNFDSLQRKAIRVVMYQGKNKVAASKFDEIFAEGYAISFEQVIKIIELNLPVNEVLSNTIREEKKLYPMIAIREFVANALIHQDFLISGSGPMIEIYEDRIEITNPGVPLIAVDRFIDHAPESRNEKLAFMMRQIGICEERGSGVDRAIMACELYQLPAPNIQNEDNYTRVTLYAPKSLSGMENTDKIRAVYQHCVLKYVMNEYMTNESLRTRFGIEDKNYSTASRIIKLAIKTGVIKQLSPELKANRYQKYIPYWG